MRIPLEVMFTTLSAGVAVGWALRVLDNLVNEYIVFEAVKRFFKT